MLLIALLLAAVTLFFHRTVNNLLSTILCIVTTVRVASVEQEISRVLRVRESLVSEED